MSKCQHLKVKYYFVFVPFGLSFFKYISLSIYIVRSVKIPLKYLALGVLVVETSSLVLLLRYSRTFEDGHDVYLSSTAVFLSEVLKMFICLLVILKDLNFSLKQLCLAVYKEVWLKPTETLKMLIPAGLYTIQNNLLFIALSNLDAATYQVC